MPDTLAETFEAQRDRLRAVAHRVLGSHADAEDVVQEAWLRLSRQDAATIENLDGWLTVFFTLVLWFVIGDMLRIAFCRLTGRPVPASSEAPYQPTQLNGNGVPAASAAHA